MEYEGYGAYIDKAEKKECAYKNLYKKIMDTKTSFLIDCIHEFYEDNKEEYKNEEDSFYDFCEDYYENESCLWSGFDGVLVDFIDEQFLDGCNTLRMEDYCIHVEATLPKNEEAKKNMPTTDQLDELFKTQIAIYYKTELKPEWVTIYID